MEPRVAPQDLLLTQQGKVEIDFIVELSNQRFVAVEVKASLVNFSAKQIDLLDSPQLNVIDRWVITPSPTELKQRLNSRVLGIEEIWQALEELF